MNRPTKRNSGARLAGLLALLWLGLALIGPAHAGTTYYYYTDAQGTVLAKADAQGNIVARYDYKPYGAPMPGPQTHGPTGYTGHVNDAETGLVYTQARYYDPVVGRFLSVDPVGPTAGNGFNFNRYTYTNNNPMRYTDPTGMCVGLRGRGCRHFASNADSGGGDPSSDNDGGSEQHQPTLPRDPSELGKDWKDVTPQGGQNPKIPERYRGPKGTEIEFDPADPSKPANTWGGRDHWHDVNPATGKRQGGHLPPGSPIPGPDGAPTPAHRSMMDRMKSIAPRPIVELGTKAVIIYIIVSEGSRAFPPRNLVPVP